MNDNKIAGPDGNIESLKYFPDLKKTIFKLFNYISLCEIVLHVSNTVKVKLKILLKILIYYYRSKNYTMLI